MGKQPCESLGVREELQTSNTAIEQSKVLASE